MMDHPVVSGEVVTPRLYTLRASFHRVWHHDRIYSSFHVGPPFSQSDTNPPALLPTLNYTMPPDDPAIFVITASYRRPGGGGAPVVSVLEVHPSLSLSLSLLSRCFCPSWLNGPPPQRVPPFRAAQVGPVPLWTKNVVSGATPVPERKCPEQQHGVYVGYMCEIYRRLKVSAGA